MAKEISRYVDRSAGAVVTQIDDGYGHTVTHTTYIAGVPDIDADIQQAIALVGTEADSLEAKLKAAGLA
jgi:hypothetical protein